jgi:hypothetical protein
LNRRITNPIVRIFAGRRLSPVAIVERRGRTSGRRCRTPIVAFRIDDGYLISLPWDRPGSFNEQVVADKPQFVRQKEKLSREDVRDVEIRNALRLAALKSVDRRIPELLAALERAEQRTGRESYVVFSSDGGFFLGEHRLPYEKNWHYGAATDVPLVISGPGVSPNAEVSASVANIDLAPSLMQMAGAGDAVTGAIDGRSLVPLLERPGIAGTSRWTKRAVLLEGFWGNTRRRRYSGVRTRSYVFVEPAGGATVLEWRVPAAGP